MEIEDTNNLTWFFLIYIYINHNIKILKIPFPMGYSTKHKIGKTIFPVFKCKSILLCKKSW